MFFALGFVAYGAAGSFARRRGDSCSWCPGAIGVLIRPNELLLLWRLHRGHDVPTAVSGRRSGPAEDSRLLRAAARLLRP